MADKVLNRDMGYLHESDWRSWPLMVKPLSYLISDPGRDGTFLINSSLGLFFASVGYRLFYLNARCAILNFTIKLPAFFHADNFCFFTPLAYGFPLRRDEF
jgi:hypothetical protein